MCQHFCKPPAVPSVLTSIDKQVHPQALAGIDPLRRNRPPAERQHYPDSKWGENAIRSIGQEPLLHASEASVSADDAVTPESRNAHRTAWPARGVHERAAHERPCFAIR